jgi:hypothetical protein
MDARRYRAGNRRLLSCRKTDRMHTVVAADADGRPIRVDCGYCHSEHNYRGGGRIGVEPGSRGGPDPRADSSAARTRAPASTSSRAADAKAAFPIVSERERTGPPMTPDREADLELLLRRVIREEAGITAVAPAEKWRNGTLVLRPGTAGLQEKTWPIETFFHKIVMLRNRLRTLEQRVNTPGLRRCEGQAAGIHRRLFTRPTHQLQCAVRGRISSRARAAASRVARKPAGERQRSAKAFALER